MGTDDYSKFLWELQFFKEEVLLPYRIELAKIFNYDNLANNYIDFKKQSKEDFNEKKEFTYTPTLIYTYYLLILQSDSCFPHFFVVKYNPVSQSIYQRKKKKKKS